MTARDYISILKDLGISFHPTWKENEIKDAIYRRMIENPEVTDCSNITKLKLQKMGYMVVDENGQPVKLEA